MRKDRLSNTEYINNIYDQINLMIQNNKFSLAKKMIAEYLERFPDSGILKRQLALTLIKEKNYEQALTLFEDAEEEKVFLQLISVYIKLNNEEKLLELYKKYYKDKTIDYSINNPSIFECYQLMGIYLRNKFEPETIKHIEGVDNYTQNQIYNYNPELTLNLIKTNYVEGSKVERKEHFNNEVDIDNLFNKVRKYISTNTHQGTIYKNFYERYEFYYPQCGITTTGEVLDSFEVFTIIGCDKILSIIPTKLNKTLVLTDFGSLDKMYDIEEKPNLVKIKSPKNGLERFKQRYKNNY